MRSAKVKLSGCGNDVCVVIDVLLVSEQKKALKQDGSVLLQSGDTKESQAAAIALPLCLHFLKGGGRKEHHVVFKKKKKHS